MADGTTRPISQVTEGDRVASFDPATGSLESATVQRTFVHQDVPTLTVSTDGGDIQTTATHPFYVEGRGYTPVAQLHAGDRLRDHTGQAVTVQSIQATGHTTTVYNLQVTGAHNYHVTTTAGTTLLVHNGDAGEECGPLRAGDVGSYKDLSSRGTVGDGLTPHHMPQAALHLTSRAEGGTIAMTHEEHKLTRTFGGRGIATRTQDSGRPFRDVFEDDVADYLAIVGSSGREHVQALRNYYQKNFPDLYGG